MRDRPQKTAVAHGGGYPAIREDKAGGMTGARSFAVDRYPLRVDIRAGLQIVQPSLEDMLLFERTTNRRTAGIDEQK
ncbi:hypothetical protein BDS110ZK18_11190 [Bradyrhizobium diazoefficiens]|uniref:Uncharacterized protein n=1 Tax=Bradyrhizobium diazoefficiens TaxID=1355477 RepID=A0A809Y3S8_9BRAD|nr:hypothetical protein XF2B_72340 [Bradyrhizobium diazoefficiens]BCF20541.1 hypothetical protein XF13B_72320 [Bradyrhizobium diazoefficiens]